MKIVTNIAFEHDTLSGQTRITINTQEVGVKADIVNELADAGPYKRMKLAPLVVATLVAIGKPKVEEITIGP